MRDYKVEFEKRVNFIKSILAESGVKGIVYGLFNHYEALLKQKMPNQNEDEIKRTVCDYISGMTDKYAIDTYNAIISF